MRASIRLGKIYGIPVGVNWSVLIIFALLAGGLSAGQFPDSYPGYPTWAYVLAGISAAVVFFLGLLAHEVSHAVLAIRNGLSVKAITLWMLGGVAELRGQTPNPGAELRIAGIGPLVSLLAGVLFGGVAAALAAAGNAGLAFGTFAWLSGINIVLAVFNILPAAPLDGGRLLRAALWRWRGDRTWAAIVSARAGRILGMALIAFGLWEFLVAANVGSLWLALLGWFLFGAAGMEEQQARLEVALSGLRVGDIMSPQPQTVPSETSVAELIDRYLLAFRHTAFPLTVDGRPVGLVTLDRARQVPIEQRATTAVRQVACPPEELVLATPEEPLTDLLPRLSEGADRRALVVQDDRLVGIVTPTDITRAVQRGALRAPTRTWPG